MKKLDAVKHVAKKSKLGWGLFGAGVAMQVLGAVGGAQGADISHNGVTVSATEMRQTRDGAPAANFHYQEVGVGSGVTYKPAKSLTLTANGSVGFGNTEYDLGGKENFSIGGNYGAAATYNTAHGNQLKLSVNGIKYIVNPTVKNPEKITATIGYTFGK